MGKTTSTSLISRNYWNNLQFVYRPKPFGFWFSAWRFPFLRRYSSAIPGTSSTWRLWRLFVTFFCWRFLATNWQFFCSYLIFHLARKYIHPWRNQLQWSPLWNPSFILVLFFVVKRKVFGHKTSPRTHLFRPPYTVQRNVFSSLAYA